MLESTKKTFLSHKARYNYSLAHSWTTSGKTFVNILNLCTDHDHDHDTVIIFFTRRSGWWWCTIRPSLAAKESARYCRQSHILIIRVLAVTLILKIANNFFFCMTLWLMMLRHHAKFWDKMVCGSGDIIWTNIHWHVEPLLWPWPWMQWSIFFSHRTLQLMMVYYQTKFGCKQTSRLEDIVKTVLLWL